MSLEFQERGGGYRVVRMVDGVERMLASVESSRLVTGPGGNRWEPLPFGECSIHSAGGAMPVSDVEEILAWLRAKAKAAATPEPPKPDAGLPAGGRPAQPAEPPAPAKPAKGKR